MEEIAASLDDAGLPGGAFQAAADIYSRLDAYKDVDTPPAIDEMVERLLYLPPTTPGT